ncbi:hypothetical protein KY331_06365 [Candidatus Woesearchaeota archaeon]|nr:hypothetical protein [Candidatus Woesearchaeota archaeon]
MKKREQLIVNSTLAITLVVVILGIIATFFIKIPGFSSITGRAVYSCSDSNYPQCGGDCPLDMLCVPDAEFGGCACTTLTKTPVYCSDSEYPVCGGYCTLGLECQPDFESKTCTCSALDTTTKRPVSVSCTPNFECSEWSSCKDGEQVKVCLDLNGCTSKTEQKRSCTSTDCVPNWQCSDWTDCKDKKQTRTCTDVNKCNTEEGKPISIKECVPAAPTGKTILSEKDKKTEESSIMNTILQKAGLILVVAFVVIALLAILIIKKAKTTVPKPPQKKSKRIYLFIILLILGLTFISYKYYKAPETKIVAKTISIDEIVPPADHQVTDNLFINVYQNLSPLKKAGITLILTVISTLVLLLVLTLNRKHQ